MSKHSVMADVKYNEEQNLQDLLETYLLRSEELEQRENKVMKQIELMQTAVYSLQEWNRNRKKMVSSEPVHLDMDQMDIENQLIQEEITRIQKEITERAQENMKLQEEVSRRKRQLSWRNDSVANKADVKIREGGTQRGQSRPGIEFFNDKLKKLTDVEKKFKKESKQQSDESKRKQKNLKERMEVLEWESQTDKKLIQSLNNKTRKK